MFSTAQMTAQVGAWARGKWWPPRAGLWLVLAYIAIRHLDSGYASIFSGLNLGVHEAGHLFFSLFGIRFLTILGGTLFEVGAPVAAAVMFFRQPDYFALVFCGVWLGTALSSVARYAGDARAMELPLVTVGTGHPQHDWNAMLRMLGLLEFDGVLSFLIRASALVLFAVSLYAGARIIQVMRTKQRANEPTKNFP